MRMELYCPGSDILWIGHDSKQETAKEYVLIFPTTGWALVERFGFSSTLSEIVTDFSVWNLPRKTVYKKYRS